MPPPVPQEYEEPVRARIPADLDTEDQILAGLTARQLLTLSVFLVPVLIAWRILAGHVPATVLLAATGPVIAGAVLLVLTRRDGLSLDRWLLAAVRHRTGVRHLDLSMDLTPAVLDIEPAGSGQADRERGRATGHTMTGAESGRNGGTARGRAGRAAGVRDRRGSRPSEAPLVAVTGGGVLVHADGRHVVVIACTTIATALATHQDDAILAAGMARWLNSLSAPVQIVVQNRPTDLASMATAVVARSQGIIQPDLAAIALDHASMLLDLAETARPLQRTVLIACSGGTSTSSEQLQRLAEGLRRRLGRSSSRTQSHSPATEFRHQTTAVRVSPRASTQALSHAHRTAAGLQALGAVTQVLDGPQVRQVLAGTWTPTLLPTNPRHGARQIAPAEEPTPAGLPGEAMVQERDGRASWDDGADWADWADWADDWVDEEGSGPDGETGGDEQWPGLQDWSPQARQWFVRANEPPGPWREEPIDELGGRPDDPSLPGQYGRPGGGGPRSIAQSAKTGPSAAPGELGGDKNALDDIALEDGEDGTGSEVLPAWKGIRAQRFFDTVRLNEPTTPRRPQ